MFCFFGARDSGAFNFFIVHLQGHLKCIPLKWPISLVTYQRFLLICYVWILFKIIS